MKQNKGLAYIFFFTTQLLNAQPPHIFKFYYGINQKEASTNSTGLDSLIRQYEKDSCILRISGYADYLGKDSANQLLSQQRANALREYLVVNNKSGRFLIADCIAYGERYSGDRHSPLGDPTNRRVDVEVRVIPIKPSLLLIKGKPVSREEQTLPQTMKGMEKLKKGESMAIEGLSFYPGRHIWLPSSQVPLSDLLYSLKQYPQLKIEIQGHICCIYTGGDALDFDNNERSLSTNRARAVYNYLVEGGIDASRLRYKGYGHSRPKIAEERTSQDEQTNRRVEILVLEEDDKGR